jgi:hypothetical protein
MSCDGAALYLSVFPMRFPSNTTSSCTGCWRKVLGGGYKITCEIDATCNLHVVLVRYKVCVAAAAGGGGAGDDEWETKCECLHFWSAAGTSAALNFTPSTSSNATS